MTMRGLEVLASDGVKRMLMTVATSELIHSTAVIDPEATLAPMFRSDRSRSLRVLSRLPRVHH